MPPLDPHSPALPCMAGPATPSPVEPLGPRTSRPQCLRGEMEARWGGMSRPCLMPPPPVVRLGLATRQPGSRVMIPEKLRQKEVFTETPSSRAGRGVPRGPRPSRDASLGSWHLSVCGVNERRQQTGCRGREDGEPHIPRARTLFLRLQACPGDGQQG